MAAEEEQTAPVLLTTRVPQKIKARLQRQASKRGYLDLAPVTRIALIKGLEVMEQNGSEAVYQSAE